MMALFPSPYEDELLYSLCARYTRLMGYRNRDKATLKHLFGHTVMTAVVDLPIYLNVFAGQLEFLGGPSANELIDRHTLLPYYVAFHPAEQREAVRVAMRAEGRPRSMLGLSASRVATPQALRYCPSCAAEERARHGEAYWHRLHQLPGVIVCPEHEVWLEDSAGEVLMLRSRRAFDTAETTIPHSVHARKVPVNDETLLFTDLACRTRDALVAPPLAVEPQTLRERYRYFLAERGLATYTGRLRPEALRAAFHEFCTTGTLGKLGLVQASSGWLLRVLYQPGKKGSHTLHHLLLQAFLNLDRDDLMKRNQPFGAGPWPCLNRAGDHYGEKRITTIRMDYTGGSPRPIATFVCSCGFGYRRAGPDRSPADSFRRTRVSSYGPVWLRALRRGWLDPDLSLDRLSEQLGVSSLTVQAQAGLLGLQKQRPGRRGAVLGSRGAEALTPKPKRSKDSEFARRRDGHRDAWLSARSERPDASVTMLGQLLPATYRWLRLHDRNWYDNNKPLRQVRQTTEPRLNWKQQDTDIAKQLRRCAHQLYSQEPPVKVTRTRLAREVGSLGLLFAYGDKLPKCMRALDELEETREGIAVRRINSTAARLRRSGDRVTRWRFIELARLRYEVRTGKSPEVRHVLEQVWASLEVSYETRPP